MLKCVLYLYKCTTTEAVDLIQTPHGVISSGPLSLPYMRPAPECRTFNSSAVEVSRSGRTIDRPTHFNGSHKQRVIDDMKSRLKDPDIARLFENTFPNTLGMFI